jgi:hypothetical protein
MPSLAPFSRDGEFKGPWRFRTSLTEWAGSDVRKTLVCGVVPTPSAYRKYIQAATASKMTAKIQRDVSLIPVFLAIGAYLKPKMEQN